MSDPPLELRSPIQFLKGVGPKRAEILNRIGIRKASDLLFHFPRDYQDMTEQREFGQLEESNKLQTIVGSISEWNRKSTRRGEMLSLYVNCDNKGYLKAIWFNAFFAIKDFAKDRKVMLTGKPKFDHPHWTMMYPQITYLSDDEDEQAVEPFLPIYPLTEGLKQFHLRQIMRNMLPIFTPLLEEVFPDDYLEAHKLLRIDEAVRAIHFPKDQTEKIWALRRFVYQELFVLQLGLAMRRLQHQTSLKASPLKLTDSINSQIRQRFPFTLTKAQERVIAEIVQDMSQPIPMNRLLQGDVGSGKTIVAVYAMLLAAANGYQSVFMAPTEVLARQHLRTLTRMLENDSFNIAPVFGGQKTAERARVLRDIATGSAQIIVGTQALIHGEIPFNKLGLVIIDEQHKFGVMQRAALKLAATPNAADSRVAANTSFDPHYLVMTATPIPRSVTMTMFGDLDVSIMNEMPPGRQPVKTYIADPEHQPAWWDFVARKVAEEHWQGYVVVPLVEESAVPKGQGLDAQSLIEVYERLSTGPLKGFRLGMIHGRMSTEEKERIMFEFRTGEIQILVATTVIEVGVDVPNANLLTIENAERFGLSQLHQLRGRIGRGKNPGYCTVFYNPSAENAQKRLKAFEKLSDGFRLAEKDFEIRGSGDLFGTQQHGMPPFRVADLVRDKEILYEARGDAMCLVQGDPGLARPEHAKLRKQMLSRYGTVLNLGDVG
ncbi:MAG: ATP-dependent DNA helicase RecG [Planctomycetaceae bacterium]|nr:ATP-dependent DNA helicase RecG [Planctomycetaceae bacterium]